MKNQKISKTPMPLQLGGAHQCMLRDGPFARVTIWALVIIAIANVDGMFGASLAALHPLTISSTMTRLLDSLRGIR